MTAPRSHSRSRPTLLEAVLVVLLFLVLLAQLLSYPPTDDPDPDGYVTYAEHLRTTRTLPESRRLPGYPAFLAVVSTLSPRPIARNVYWVQLALMMLCSGVAWALLRRWAGPLVAATALGIVAAPSYLTRMSVVMLPDAVYTFIFLPVFSAIGWWVLSRQPRGGWLWLLPFAIGLFVLQALRPTTAALTLLLIPALLVGAWAQRRDTLSPLPWKVAFPRLGALLAVALTMFILVDHFLDTGARAYNADVPLYRVVIYLPPASDAPAEQRIEAAKARFREQEGQPIERARFLTYLVFQFSVELPLEDVRAVWLARLMAHPTAYLGSVVEDLRLGHYQLTRTMVPFFIDLDRIPLFRILYPRDDGSPAARVFYQSGLEILEREPYPATFPVETAVLQAVLRVIAFWGLLVLGAWQLAKPAPGQVALWLTLAALFTLMTAATNTVDARYLLPFMPPVVLAQAVGLVWIARTLAGWTGTGPQRF
ncbi:MAG: hypothetical protein IT306_26860 [Chloroflexi bacterium]|nr:hypothetical protein [Chloroflexota bacterium]